jgi:hypothetical protein
MAKKGWLQQAVDEANNPYKNQTLAGVEIPNSSENDPSTTEATPGGPPPYMAEVEAYHAELRKRILAADIADAAKNELLRSADDYRVNGINLEVTNTHLDDALVGKGKYGASLKGHLLLKKQADRPGQAQLMSTQSSSGGLLNPAPITSLLTPNGGR